MIHNRSSQPKLVLVFQLGQLSVEERKFFLHQFNEASVLRFLELLDDTSALETERLGSAGEFAGRRIPRRFLPGRRPAEFTLLLFDGFRFPTASHASILRASNEIADDRALHFASRVEDNEIGAGTGSDDPDIWTT